MRDNLIALIIRDKARLLQLLVGLVVGLIVTGLLKLGITLDTADTATMTALVAIVVGWAIEIWTGEVNNKGAARVQRALNNAPGRNIPVDEFMGPETVMRAEEVVKALNRADSIRPSIKGKPPEQK